MWPCPASSGKHRCVIAFLRSGEVALSTQDTCIWVEVSKRSWLYTSMLRTRLTSCKTNHERVHLQRQTHLPAVTPATNAFTCSNKQKSCLPSKLNGYHIFKLTSSDGCRCVSCNCLNTHFWAWPLKGLVTYSWVTEQDHQPSCSAHPVQTKHTCTLMCSSPE